MYHHLKLTDIVTDGNRMIEEPLTGDDAKRELRKVRLALAGGILLSLAAVAGMVTLG